MRVSIIIPVYNIEKYILRCLTSVAKQTVREGVECIVVDDCGQDSSMTIVDEFVNEYEGNIEFVVFHNERNIGLSGARNSGIRIARGEYLYFLDGDDEIKHDCIEGFLHIVEKYPSVDLVQGLYENNSPYMTQFFSKPIPLYTSNRGKIKRMLLDYDEIPVTAHNKFVRSDVIKRNGAYFREGIIHEDNHWSFFLAKYITTFALYKSACYVYYTTPGSIMTTLNKEKETKAYQTMLVDFSSNIDDFLKGEQKRSIFIVLQIIVNSGFYHTEEEKRSLIKRFMKTNNLLEWSLLCLCLRYPHIGILTNMLIHLYRLEDKS